MRPKITLILKGTEPGREHHSGDIYYQNAFLCSFKRFRVCIGLGVYVFDGAMRGALPDETGSRKEFSKILRKLMRKKGFKITSKEIEQACFIRSTILCANNLTKITDNMRKSTAFMLELHKRAFGEQRRTPEPKVKQYSKHVK